MENFYKRFLSEEMLKNIKEKHDIAHLISYEDIQKITDNLISAGVNCEYEVEADEECSSSLRLIWSSYIGDDIVTAPKSRFFLRWSSEDSLITSYRFSFLAYHIRLDTSYDKSKVIFEDDDDYAKDLLFSCPSIISSMMHRLLKKIENPSCVAGFLKK